MISHDIKGKDLIGRKCRPTQDIPLEGGVGISKDTICTILKSTKGLTIRTEACKCCGRFTFIKNVNRDLLELLPKDFQEEEWYDRLDKQMKENTNNTYIGRVFENMEETQKDEELAD